jgi:hypothetical protein
VYYIRIGYVLDVHTYSLRSYLMRGDHDTHFMCMGIRKAIRIPLRIGIRIHTMRIRDDTYRMCIIYDILIMVRRIKYVFAWMRIQYANSFPG